MNLFLHQFVAGCGMVVVVFIGIIAVFVVCGIFTVIAVKMYRRFIWYMEQEIAKAKTTTKEAVQWKS